jgi:ArsR family transcriptional regulator
MHFLCAGRCFIKKKRKFALVQANNIPMRKRVYLNADKLEVASELMRALAHPLRLKIVEFLDTNKNINVNKIYNTLKLEQSITSQHLRILRTSGLVLTEKEGKYIHYHVNYEKIKHTIATIRSFMAESKYEIVDLEDDFEDD